MTTVAELLASSSGIAGGPNSRAAQTLLSSHLSGADVRLTTSGTAALEMAAMLAEVEPGDTVLVPSFGFVTTALAFVRAGAHIRFVDVEEQTLGMDPDDLAAKLDESVRAVVPIHYAGIPCRIDEIVDVVSNWERVSLIEDNAHGLFGSLNEKPLGNYGDTACLSFHGTKNVSCGEGGAIVLNDIGLIDRAEIVLEKGTDRQSFLRGQVDKYTWRDLGSSFGLGDYLAAILVTQLEQASGIQEQRRELFDHYMSVLSSESEVLRFRLPQIQPGHQPAYHIFYVLLEDAALRDDLLQRMRDAGIPASFHFVPLHRSPGGHRWGNGESASCPVSDSAAASIVRLPLDHQMKREDAERSAEVFLDSLASLLVAK